MSLCWKDEGVTCNLGYLYVKSNWILVGLSHKVIPFLSFCIPIK